MSLILLFYPHGQKSDADTKTVAGSFWPLAACTTPLPEDKADYVGEWRAPGMYLLITQDGTVAYERLKGGATVSVNGPLKEFEGSNLIVGVGFVTTTFVVSTPPYLANDSKWKMVVDDVELTKS